jgi:hypothetical protein
VAALFVNVIAIIFDNALFSVFFDKSSLINRSVKACVFPDPAEALTLYI